MRKALVLILVSLLAVPSAGGFAANASPIPMPPELWLMNADGSDQRAIHALEPGDGWHYVSDHDWSPDGTEIAFIADGSLLIYSLESGITRTVVEGSYSSYVDWSPTGEWIAVATHSGTPRGLFLVRPDGTEMHHAGPDGQAVEPEWSPDGTRIVATYFYDPEQNVELTIVSITGESQVVASDLSFTTASWSPDGTQVTYADRDHRVSVVRIDDGSIAKITATNTSYGYVDWSPDGTQIAYAGQLGVFTINPDGSGKVKLLDNGGSPTWHPTGESLTVDLGDDIMQVPIDGSITTNLTNSPERYDSDPMWSPDVTQIAFISSEKPYIPPDETIELSVILRAREHLVLKGRVHQEGQEYSACTQRPLEVVLQHRSSDEWNAFKRVDTRPDGRFRAEVADRIGRYRALVERTVFRQFGAGNKITCKAARSPATSHRH